MLIEKIGAPATLEQLAEECAELGHACLKLARFLREENPVYDHETKELIEEDSDEALRLVSNVEEEIADVLVTSDELENGGIISFTSIDSYYMEKMKRMFERLNNDLEEKENEA